MVAENYQQDPLPSEAALVKGTDLVMTLLAGIREQVVEITIGAVIPAVGFFTFLKMSPHGPIPDIIACCAARDNERF